MKKALKRSLSIVLAITIIFSSALVGLSEIDFSGLFAVKAHAASENDLTFSLNSDGNSYSVIECYIYANGTLVIPDTYNGFPVTSITGSAFYSCANLTSITIPNSITYIGDSAFEYCTSLTSIIIPGSVTNIERFAFRYCNKLSSITIPDSVTSIGGSAFYDTGYYNNSANWENNVLYIDNHLIKANDILSGEYEIKEGTKTIADSAFEYCDNLVSITIPDSVINIGYKAFYCCGSLSPITIGNGVTIIGKDAFNYTAYYNDNSNWEDNVLYLGNYLIKTKTSASGEYTIKDGTKTIADAAFYECYHLTSITIPNSVTSIGESSFYNCDSLYSITIPNSITSISDYAFSGCTCLASITLGENIVSIGDVAFGDCGALTSIVIPDSVKSIGDSAFVRCTNLTSITIGRGVTSIGASTFCRCTNLTSIVIPDNVISIGVEAFFGCINLTSVSLSNNVKNIGVATFEGCSGLTSITIPDSITSIGDCTFYDCTNLTSISIPDSVTSIGKDAFYNCEMLESVYITDLITWNNIDFKNEYSDPMYYADNLYINGKPYIDDYYTIKVTNSSGNLIPGATVNIFDNVETIGTYTTGENGIAIFKKGSVNAVGFNVEADGYEKYTTEGTNFNFEFSAFKTIVMYTKEEAKYKLREAMYINSNAEHVESIGKNVNLIVGTKRLSLSNSSQGYFKIECKPYSNNVSSYELYQNETKISTNNNGTFNLRINQFIEGGNVYVKVINSDGTSGETKLNLEFCNDKSVDATSLKFSDKISFSVDDDIPFVGGSEFTFDIPDLPVEFAVEEGKAYLGINTKLYTIDENKSVKEQWDDITKTMSDIKKLGNYKVGSHLESNINQFLKSREKFNLPMVGEVEVMFFGGGEVEWSESVDKVTIDLYVLANFSAKKNWQTVVYVVPVTVNLKVGADVKLDASGSYDFQAKVLTGDIELEIKPNIDVFGGVGVSTYVGVGAYGSAELPIGIQLVGTTTTPGLNYVDLTGELGLKAYAGPFEYKKSFTHNTWHLYTKTKKNFSSLNGIFNDSNGNNYGLYDSSQYKISNLDYLESESSWLGATVSVYNFRKSTSATFNPSPMLKSTYRNTQPVIAQNGEYAVLVFVGADTQRADQNASIVMYSVYNNSTSTWSEPVQVDSDETADTTPFVYTCDGNLYLAYQNSTKEFSENTSQGDYISSQAISVYKFNNENQIFNEEITFSSNGSYYRNPQIANINGTPTIAWSSSTDSDIFGQGANNDILYSQFVNGVWTTPEKAVEKVSTITSFSIGELNRGLAIAYVSDSDNNLNTEDDITLICKTGSSENEVASGVVSELHYVTLPSEDSSSFVFINNENIYSYNGEKEVVFEGVGSPESLSVLSDKLLITLADNKKSQIYSISYSETEDMYGLPIKMTNQALYIENVTAVDFNSQQLVTMTRKNVEISTSDVNDDCELSWITLGDVSDLSLDYVEYDKDNAVPGKEAPLYLTITNNGSDAVKKYIVTIKDSNGNVVTQKTILEQLMSGETKNIELKMSISENATLSNYTLTVEEDGIAEANTVNNSVNFTIGYSDLIVDVQMQKISNTNTAVITVVNEGTATTGGVVEIYNGDSETPVKTITIESLEAHKKSVYFIDVTDDMVNDETGNIRFNVVSDAEELYTENNEAIGYVIEFDLFENETTTLKEINGQWVYANGNTIITEYTGLVEYNGNWFYVANGILDWNYTDLVEYGGTYYHIANGVLDWNYTGLSYYQGNWWYVTNGVIDWSYTGLTNYYGTWYYVTNGFLDWNVTTLTYFYGSWYYVENGKVNFNATTLVYFYDVWYYVENGVLNWDYTGLAEFCGQYYHIANGVLDWGYSGLSYYQGNWWYVTNGVIDWNYTGLTYYYGTWYYVVNGYLDWNVTTLTYFCDVWYYVENGVINWNSDTLCYYGDTWYYVKGGTVAWDYTGWVEYYGGWYYITNGWLDWSRQ